MKRFLLAVFVLVLFGPSGWGQSGFVASGGDIMGPGGNASYSVGQLAYITSTGPSGSVSEGIQQPYEIYTTGIDDQPGITLSFKTYPNPVTAKLYLVVDQPLTDDILYTLTDISGRVLQKQNIIGTTTEIAMDSYPAAAYMLSIFNRDNNSIKSFKIIKQ